MFHTALHLQQVCSPPRPHLSQPFFEQIETRMYASCVLLGALRLGASVGLGCLILFYILLGFSLHDEFYMEFYLLFGGSRRDSKLRHGR